MKRNLFKNMKFTTKRSIEALIFLVLFIGVFGGIGSVMGLPNMLNTIMNTSYSLLLETVFYLMGITVLSGALGKLLVEFGVVRLLENILRPLMKPLYNLPGVAALGAVITFLSSLSCRTIRRSSDLRKTRTSAAISKNTSWFPLPISGRLSEWVWC